MKVVAREPSIGSHRRSLLRRFGVCGVVVAALVSGLGVTPAQALAPTTVDSFLWQVDGRVRAIIETPTAIYMAGQFTHLVGPGGQTAARTNFAAISPVTGGPLPFVANVNKQIWNIALSPDGSTVYAVGDFTTANGASRQRAAAFDATTGAVKPWNPRLGDRGLSVEALGSRVYIGGDFTDLGGQPRSHLAAVDTTNGALIPTWTATADDAVDTITATNDGSKILVGGLFTSISGSPGQTQRKVASLDPATGVPQPWADHPNFEIFDLEVSNTQVFAAGGGSGGHAEAWDLATGQEQWTDFGDGDAVAVQYQNGIVYIGGHFTTWHGTQSGHLIAAQPTTGVQIPWSIKVNSNLGIFSLASFQGHLSIGGDFTQVNNLSRQHYARFSESVDQTAPTTPGKPTATIADPTSVALSWSASTDESVSSIIYTIYRDNDTSPSGSVTSNSTTTVSFTDHDLMPGSTHTWRVQASDGGNLSPFSPASDPVTLPSSDVPLLTSLRMLDVDADAKVDTVVATFSSTVTCVAPCKTPWTLTNVPSNGSLIDAVASGNTMTLNLKEGPQAGNTAVGTFRVALAAGASGVVDAGGHAASFAATAPLDKAGPVPLDLTSSNGVTTDVMEPGDTFTVTFSEPVDPSSVIAANIKELDPAGPGTDQIIIVGLTSGPMDLLDDNIVLPDGGTVVYQSSTLTMLTGNTKIRSTVVGSCTGTACGQQGVGSEKLITFAPEPFLKDFAGNGATGSHTETEAIF